MACDLGVRRLLQQPPKRPVKRPYTRRKSASNSVILKSWPERRVLLVAGSSGSGSRGIKVSMAAVIVAELFLLREVGS
jgi:hypothetical protein